MLVGVSHLPQVLQFKVDPMSQHNSAGSAAQCWQFGPYRELRLLTTHKLCTSARLFILSQWGSEVYNLVSQSQISSGMTEQRTQFCGQWVMRQSESRTKFIRIKIWKLTVERTFCTLYHLPINTNGETSLFTLSVKMDVPALERAMSSGQYCKEAILRHENLCYSLYQMCPMASLLVKVKASRTRWGWGLECSLPSHSCHLHLCGQAFWPQLHMKSHKQA